MVKIRRAHAPLEAYGKWVVYDSNGCCDICNSLGMALRFFLWHLGAPYKILPKRKISIKKDAYLEKEV